MRNILFVVGVYLTSVWAASSEFKSGAAEVKINPPLGAPLSGYYSARGSEGVMDDIYAKALVLEKDGVAVALVSCDLLTLPRHTVVEARRLIQESTGIPGTNVMIGATHQHTGPAVSHESSRDKLDGGDTELALQYTSKLPVWIAEAVKEAKNRVAPAKLFAGRGEERQMAYNRRFWMKNGSVSWNPAKRDRTIIRPAGPVDPEVAVFYLETPDGKPVSTYVNFAMHPDTTGGRLISADYPGALYRRLAEFKGPAMVTLFANGTCGNINHREIQWAANQTSQAEANRLGTILAANVFKIYPRMEEIVPGPIGVRSRIVPLPLAPITPEDVAKAKKVMASLQDRKSTFMEQVKAFQVIDIEERNGKPLEVEVQVISIGKEIAWVSLPGEIFVELGLSIKQASPFRYTAIAELANGSIGYIPNKTAYVEGNYEVVSARCAEGSGELLVTNAIEMLEELKAAHK